MIDVTKPFILIVAPCPFGVSVVEGWMARIKAVDEIFADTPRIYIDPFTKPASGPSAPIRHSEFVTEYKIDFIDSTQSAFVEPFILRAKIVYVHTAHLARYLLPFFAIGKIVTDMHGIVPEEERMLGSPEAGAFYEGVERVIMMNSRVIVVVTEAMRDHLLDKHPESPARFIVLPIAELASVKNFSRRRRETGDRYRAIYAGGTQVWQNVPLMIETARPAADFCDFTFLSQDHEKIRALAAGSPLETTSFFGVCDKSEVPEHYRTADFGFVLRDPTAVNRVSCPTKLTEYLWYGLIPIVKTPLIGDYVDFGYVYITAEEFTAGLIPDELALEEMRRGNREAVNRLVARFHAAARELKHLELYNGIHGGSLAGLPVGMRHLHFPAQTEIHFNGATTEYQSRSFIDLLEEIDWVPALDQAISSLMVVPILTDAIVEITDVDLETTDDPRGIEFGCCTPGYAKTNGIYLEQSDPSYFISISRELRITKASFRWKIGPLGVCDRISTPNAPRHTVTLRLSQASKKRNTTQSVVIQCEGT